MGDPNRLNYASLNMLRPADVQNGLSNAYTPSLIRRIVRTRVLESKAKGSQVMRGKLVDWLRAHIPAGFCPKDAPETRQQAWLYEQCHNEDFHLRDVALNFVLCGMHILRADRIACVTANPDVAGPPLCASS